MSRLSARPGYDADLAAELKVRCNEPHTVQWQANVFRGGVELLHDAPIIGGTLLLDSSDPIRRRMTLEIGGGEALAPRNEMSPLVPFGQYIVLRCRIDKRAAQQWFPWLGMGVYHIVTHTFERPSYITTVECVDLAGRVDEFLFLRRRSFVGQTLAEAVTSMVDDAVGGYDYTVDASAAATNPSRLVKSFVADAGQGRWDAITELSGNRGHEVFWDADGNLVIRRGLADDDDETIPANGPDVGTVTNPIAVIRAGEHGNMIGLTATVSRQGACNAVRLNLHSTVPQKVKKPSGRTGEWATAPINAHVTETQATGPVMWGGDFGYLPLVVERDVKDLKGWSSSSDPDDWSDIQEDAHHDAKRLLHRRRGVTRYLDLHCLPLPWLEPDDKIRIRWNEFDDDTDKRTTSEAHYVARVEYDLAGGPMVVRTRMLSTVDPGTAAT